MRCSPSVDLPRHLYHHISNSNAMMLATTFNPTDRRGEVQFDASNLPREGWSYVPPP